MTRPFRIFLRLAAIILILLIAGYAHCSTDDAFGGVPFPRHVEWTRYIVPEGTWMLVRPAVEADSVSTPYISMSLSAGTEIYVPRFVPGRDPNGDASTRKAAR